jgi:hypothetical protein
MAPLPGSGPWSVDQRLEAVEHLSPAEQREFQRRLAARHAANGSPGPDEATLVRTARARLPAAAECRLRRLIARSERGQLTPKELAEYRSLARRPSGSTPHGPKRWRNWPAAGATPCRP